MMSCSYLSAAAMAPEASGAACWTPPAMACPPPMACPPAVKGPSSMLPPYVRPPSLLSLPMPAPAAPGPAHEPALDLTKPSSSLKCHLPSPASEETE